MAFMCTLHFGVCLYLCLTFCVSTLSVHGNTGLQLRLSVEPEDIVAVAGSGVVLDCSAEASDLSRQPTIKWRTADGQHLTYIGDPHRRQLNNNSLLLSSVAGEEQYQCVATIDNVGSIVSRTTTVSLTRLPPFEQQPRDLRLFPGQTALFSCWVDAWPPPHVSWLKDGRPLVLDESRMIVLPSGSLEIETVQVSDRGSYRCNVSDSNQHRLSEKAMLHIDQDLESANSLMAPTFVATPRSTVVTEGNTVTLECAANGNPQPWLVWLKDGVAIDLADLDTNFVTVGTGSLQMTDVEEDDSGNYQCRAENREDSVDATATLHVQVAPRFLKKPSSKVAREKEDVELECSVYAAPEARVSWLKNGDHIKQNEYLQVVNGNNLRILGLMSLDAGIFQCVASNPAGNIQAAAQLIVTSSDSNVERQVASGVVASEVERESASGSERWSRPSMPPGLLALEGETEVEVGVDEARGAETAPRAVEAAIVGARFITLRWKPPHTAHADISSYSVFYREEGSHRERVVNTSRSRLEEVNIQGLQPDRNYLLRVGAYVNQTLGTSSRPITVRTRAEVHVPGPPQRVQARPLSPSSIHVSWLPPALSSDPHPVTGYSLYYLEEDASDEFHRNTSELSYTLQKLKMFQEYNLWVVAHNENGAGSSSEELTVRTFSDAPTKPPENITLEAASSTTVYVRWEPPPKDGQNGLITGYKVRYRKKDQRGKGDTLTAAGNQHFIAIQNLDKSSVYQVRLFAINVNGSSPASDWYTIETYENDLDESTTPDEPATMRVRPSTDSITVSWTPPANPNVMVRGYTIGWGKGIPDTYFQVLDGKQRFYAITGLEPNSEYVISLRASNNPGDGPAKYESVRTRDELPPEPTSPLIPPVGLKAIVLSSSTVVVYWTDSTLAQSQLVTDNRYYTVRYASCHHSGNPRYKYYNSTDLNCMIDDLKPNTQYEFTVKVVKGRRESRWSMVVSNTTLEDAPSSPPRDLTVVPVDGNPTTVNLNWQPPKQPNGQITGYVVSYTTDLTARDRDWVVEGVVGDRMTTSIKGLTPSTTYYFKIQARNGKGYGPMSNTVSMTTGPGSSYRHYETSSSIKDGRGGVSNVTLLLILLACCVLLVAGVAIGIAIVCCRRAAANTHRNKKGYTKGNTGKGGASNIKPPDLWIHHDQMDLKNMEKSSQGSLEAGSATRDRDLELETRIAPTGSLDKRAYTTSYIGNASQPLLLPEEKCSSARRVVKAKPIALPVESQPLREPSATATPIGPVTALGGAETRPLYPRTQYCISRAHVTLDPNTSAMESPSSIGVSGYESVAGAGAPGPAGSTQPPSATSNYGVTGEGTGSLGKRLQGHPLKSFSVPAPPPQSAPSTPQQKHVVTVRPQGSSPYKKAGNYSGPSPAPAVVPPKARSSIDDSPKLQPSYSTEELNQEMANLEGLMKDLNAITASEFEC